jgi:hypothetical protein
MPTTRVYLPQSSWISSPALENVPPGCITCFTSVAAIPKMPAFDNAHHFTIGGGIFNADVQTQIINIGTQFLLNKDDLVRGIVETLDDRTLSLLPLEKVHIDVSVVDGNVHLVKLNACCTLTFTIVSACVTLKQTFTNPSETVVRNAKYVLPVPARAAVCAFEMHFADRRVIIGVSKEKARAAREYKTAVNAGKTAGLVDWVTDDSSLCNHPSNNDTHIQSSVHHFCRVYTRKADSDHSSCVRHGADGR